MNRAVQQEDEWKREPRYQLPGLPYNWGLNHRERGAPVNGLTGKKKGLHTPKSPDQHT